MYKFLNTGLRDVKFRFNENIYLEPFSGGGRHSVQISLGNGSRASINSFNQAIAARGGRLFGSLPGGVMSFDLNGTAQFNRLLEHVMAHSENDEPQNTGLSEARINRLPLSEVILKK